jgi:biotin carboxylase
MWLFPFLSIATIAAIAAVLVLMYLDPEVRPQLVLSLLAWAILIVLYLVTRWRGGSVDPEPVVPDEPVEAAELAELTDLVEVAQATEAAQVRVAEPAVTAASPMTHTSPLAQPSPLAQRVLALANATVSADELLDELRRLSESSPSEYFVCVPANPVHSSHGESEKDSAATATRVAAAQGRLDYTLGVLRGEGIKAEGSLGDCRPMHALQTAVTDFRPDLLVVSTHPEEQSAWLTSKVVQQARQAHSMPVTHVISHARPGPLAARSERESVADTAVKVTVSDAAVKVAVGESAVKVTVSDTGAVEVVVAGTKVAQTAGWQSHGHLRGISEIRTFFRTNEQPIYFFGPTAFNLLGIDRWVRNFQYVAYYDSWDGSHPHVFAPQNRPFVDFESSEQMNNYLLRDAEVQEHLRRRGGTPMIAMVFFDEETEEICRELGYNLILPPDSLRRHLDSKIVTTQLGNEAGAPSVPNVLARADSYVELVALSTANSLGTDLVVQTPYGDSGKTTFFVASEADWDKHADDIIGQEAKVMKRINNNAACVEACITRHGTIVGPFMTDLTGYPELTPYQGGWCGNDLFPEALSDAQRATAIEYVRRMGDRLSKEGYKGFFEVDVLVDTDSDEVYLGEINPRISGASSMTNVTAGAYADVPLFLFHLLEYMDVDYTIDVEEINARWRELAAVDVWSQLIMKEPVDSVERILTAPRTGTYQLSADGELTFSRVTTDWHDVTHSDEAFYLRVYAPGDYRFKGADLGILVTKGRMQTADGLTERCRRYINGIRAQYRSEILPEPPTLIPIAYVK